jgi:hypothetical protein
MTLKDLITKSNLSKADLEKEILFSNDEELNNLHSEAQIAELGNTGKLVIYPLTMSRTEI